MKIWLLILICLAPLTAAAAIYKSVDANGNVVYSDTPRPGAKEINLPPPPTYTPPPLPKTTTPAAASSTAPASTSYTTLRVVKPQPEATIHDNTGAVDIGIELTPALNTQGGDKLVIELDGKRLGVGGAATTLTMSNLDRGAHTLKAMVVDAQERVLISSDTTTFYMQRTSLLQRNAPQPNTPPGTGGSNAPNTPRNPGNRSDNPNIISPTPNLPPGIKPAQPSQ